MSKVATTADCVCHHEAPITLSREALKIRAIQDRIGEKYYLPISRQTDMHWNFGRLVNVWKNETGHLSSIRDRCMHPAYQRIMGMGSAVVPLILREMQREPDLWFWALKYITGDNPIRPEHRGQIDKMTEDWSAWGRRNIRT